MPRAVKVPPTRMVRRTRCGDGGGSSSGDAGSVTLAAPVITMVMAMAGGLHVTWTNKQKDCDAIEGERKSLMVHVEGTRALQARQPVSTMSGVFVDLALAANVPVIPVRFAHGLPLEPLSERLEFPVGLGRQAYHLGAPILPDELRALTYKTRSERILRAINQLGPDVAQEQPSPAEALLGPARVGVPAHFDVLMNVVAQHAPDGSALRSVCSADSFATASARAAEFGPWMSQLVALFFGQETPKTR